jgi:hypothetical protein
MATKKLNRREEPYEEIYNIMETDDGYYLGVYNVMFGKRIRAGKYGNGWVDLDWCCGDDDILLGKVYTFLLLHFERTKNSSDLFSSLPSCSSIKPLKHDKVFLSKVTNIIPEFSNIEYEQI